MPTQPVTSPTGLLLLTAAERAVLRQTMPADQPLLTAAVQQADGMTPFLHQLADLLRTGQSDAALTQLDAALAPVAALDANADGLGTALRDLTSAWLTLAHLCPDGVLSATVLTDPAALRTVAEAAEAVSEQAQEIGLRAADRARLLAERMRG